MEKNKGEKSTLDLIKQEIQAFQRQNKNPLKIYCCASNILVEKLVNILENEKGEKTQKELEICEASPDRNSRSRSKSESRATLIPFLRLRRIDDRMKCGEPELEILAHFSSGSAGNGEISGKTKSQSGSRSRKKGPKPKDFECDYCGKEFSSNYKKLRHHVVHTGQRDFSCTVCSKTFADKSYLKKHLKIHSANVSASASASTRGQKIPQGKEPEKFERTFKCTHRGCDFAARENKTLTRHLLVHTEERLFKCQEINCNYAAKWQNNLKRHQLTHKFTCSVSGCSFKTARKGHLTKHLKTHKV